MSHISFEYCIRFAKESKFNLQSTQDQLCYPIVERMYYKMKNGLKLPGIKVDGDLIIDGHHRYFASLLAGVPIKIYPSLRTSATIITKWDTVYFVNEDWDTEAKILFLNKLDARDNGITIEKLLEILK